MAGLNGLLDLGAGAIAAHSAGVSVAGRNLGNVHTEGYSRQSAELAPEPGGGVRASTPRRMEDALLARRERLAGGQHGHARALAAGLDGLERALPSEKLVDAIAKLFGAVAGAAAAPLDDARRGAVVASARSLAATFRDAAREVETARADADARVAGLAVQATALAREIAATNRALAGQPDPTLADRRDLAAQRLAEIVGGQARVDGDGMMRFVVARGVVLVDGDRAVAIEALPAAGGALVRVVDGAHADDVTTSLDGGRIAGELSFRDGTARAAGRALDDLAGRLIAQVNAVHVAHAGRDGVSGRPLFVPPPPNAGAALAMEVDPVVVADPRRVALAAPGAGPGDNAGARALLALRDQPLAAGGVRTFVDEAIHLLGEVGAATRSAREAEALESERGEVLRATRAARSGVSTDEELARLAAAQRGVEAARRFVSTVNDLLGELIQRL